jgi:hypothetical protein
MPLAPPVMMTVRPLSDPYRVKLIGSPRLSPRASRYSVRTVALIGTHSKQLSWFPPGFILENRFSREHGGRAGQAAGRPIRQQRRSLGVPPFACGAVLSAELLHIVAGNQSMSTNA